MAHLIIPALLWFSAIGSGLIAGIFFAFSTFIMTAFARIAVPHGISAMQSINTTILGSLFMPVFFGTTLASGLLSGFALFRWDEPASATMLAAGLIYIVGMFVCTLVFNVLTLRQYTTEDFPFMGSIQSRPSRRNAIEYLCLLGFKASRFEVFGD